MPRINRKIRIRPQNRVTRAQILELLLGPNGKSVFSSRAAAEALWADQQQKYSPAFAAQWHIAGGGSRPYIEIASRYARDVVDGRISACRWTKLACARHLRDLERAQSEEGWRYRFDIDKAARACRFLELLPHTKGRWAARAELMVLEPWQVFIVCSIFGWLKAETGERRFSVAYILVPRKNGKSQLAAGIGLYMFACDLEHGAEVYSGATTEKQAHEVFRPARLMLERSPELVQALGVLPPRSGAKGLRKPEDGSRFEVVIGKPGDGASPHCGIVDEYHEHDTDDLYDTFRTGMGARTQPLVLVISTAGSNTAGPCRLLQGDICNTLEGKPGFERDAVFGIVYSIDPGDSWTDPESLPKANPNLGVSVSREFLVGELQAAILNPRKQGIFQTKYQNVWLGAVLGYFDVEKWRKLADPSLRVAQFIGLPCVVSEDLSTKRDFTVRAATFKKRVAGKDHYYIFVRVYLPSAQIERADAPHYKDWAAAKAIHVHRGETVDFEAIEDDTVADIKAYGAREFAYDPWNAGGLAQQVEKRTSAQIVEFPQNPKFMSPAMKELDAAIADGRVHHEGNPVVEWMIGNVVAHEDANENVMARKEAGREEKKIDGAVAAIMGVGRAKFAEPDRIKYTGLRSVG